MAIKEFITLEGVDEVERELKKLAQVGEESLGKFGKEIDIPGLAIPRIDTAQLQALSQETKGVSDSMANAATSVSGFNDSMRLLSRTASLAGIQLGKFTALARLIPRLGPAGIATGIVAAAGAGLGILEEQTERTKGELTDLFDDSAAVGEKAFQALTKQAQQFGSSVSDLQPGLESLKKALDAFPSTARGFVALRPQDLPGGGIRNLDALVEIYSNFLNLLRAGRLTQDQAEKSAASFFAAIEEGGEVTADLLKKLPTGTVQLLAEAFGRGQISARQFTEQVKQSPISLNEFARVLESIGPQAQSAFDTKAIKTMGDELRRIGAILGELFKTIAGVGFSDLIVAGLKKIREGLEALKPLAAEIGKAFREHTIAGQLLGGEEAAKSDVEKTTQTLKKGFVDASQSLEKLGAAGVNAGQHVTQALSQINTQLQTMRDRARATGEELPNVFIGSTKFSGVRNQIKSFVPQLAGEFDPLQEAAEKDADEAAKKAEQRAREARTFIENVFSKEVVVPIVPEVKTEQAAGIFDKIQSELNRRIEQGEPLVNVKRMFEGATLPTIDLTPWTTALTTWGAGAISQVESIWERFKQILSQPIDLNVVLPGGAPLGMGGIGSAATGGMVRGPGSTTSDSILALLSNKEFVVRAAAVSHYGPDLFAALNAMRLPRDFLGGFSMGGLARAISGQMRFAEGGQVNSSLTLVLGGRQFEARASEGTITALRRFAVNSQLASIGRKPGFVR